MESPSVLFSSMKMLTSIYMCHKNIYLCIEKGWQGIQQTVNSKLFSLRHWRRHYFNYLFNFLIFLNF